MVMKKRIGRKKESNFNVIFLIIVIIILAVAVYLAFISPNIQFSPADNSRQIANAVIQSMGNVETTCGFLLKGRPPTMTDLPGNVYTQNDASDLVIALGGKKVVNTVCKQLTSYLSVK